MSKATRPTLLPSARALSVWSTAVPYHQALDKYQSGEALDETELYELVEYGVLTIVGPEWLGDEVVHVKAQAPYGDSEADQPADGWTPDAAESAGGGDDGVDGDEPGGCDVESFASDSQHTPTGDDT